MSFINLYYLLVAFSVSTLITPFVLNNLKSLNFLDFPNNRKVHKKDILTGGGTIIFLGVFLTLTLIHILPTPNLLPKFDDNLFLLAYLSGFIVLFTIGIIDDKINVPAWLKFFFQIISCCLFISISNNYIVLDFLFPNVHFISFLSTLFFMLSIINAINFIDGLDGLASSLSIITLVSLSLLLETFLHVNLIFVLIGATFAFLVNNIRPANVFLGDSGSYILGYSVGVFSVFFLSNQETNFTGIFHLLLIVGIPVIDIVYVLARRLIKNKRIYVADKKHLHHQMLKNGISHKNSVIYLVFSQTIITFTGLCLINSEINIFPYVLLMFLPLIIYYCLNNDHCIRNNFFDLNINIVRKLNFTLVFIIFFFSIYTFYNFSSTKDFVVASEIDIINEFIYHKHEFFIIFLILTFMNTYLIFRKQSNVIFSNIFASIIAIDFSNIFLEWIDLIASYLWLSLVLILLLHLIDSKIRNKLLKSYNSIDYLYIVFLFFISLSSNSDLIGGIYILKVFLIILALKILSVEKVILKNNLIYFVSLISIVFFFLGIN